VLPDTGDIAATKIRVSPLMVAFRLIRRPKTPGTIRDRQPRKTRRAIRPSPILSLRMSWVETVARSQLQTAPASIHATRPGPMPHQR